MGHEITLKTDFIFQDNTLARVVFAMVNLQ